VRAVDDGFSEGCSLRSAGVLVVADLFEPVDIAALDSALNGDMGHLAVGVAPCQCLIPGGVQITSGSS
jgi:hypothetical protein